MTTLKIFKYLAIMSLMCDFEYTLFQWPQIMMEWKNTRWPHEASLPGWKNVVHIYSFSLLPCSYLSFVLLRVHHLQTIYWHVRSKGNNPPRAQSHKHQLIKSRHQKAMESHQQSIQGNQKTYPKSTGPGLDKEFTNGVSEQKHSKMVSGRPWKI